MRHVLTFVRSHDSLTVVIAATVAGLVFPAFASPLQPLIPLLVAGLIVPAFYGLDVHELSAANLSTPAVVSLAVLYLVVPLALYPVAAVVLTGEILLGAAVVLSAPLTAGSSILWTRLSGGDALLSTVIVLLSMGLAPLVMPGLLTLFAGSSVELATSDVVLDLAAIILGAAAVAYVLPQGVVSDTQFDVFSVATLGTLIYVGVSGATLSGTGPQLAAVGGLAMAALGLSAGVAYLLDAFGVRRDACVTVMFSSSMKNLSVSVMVGAILGGGAIIASITAFHVVQQITSSAVTGHVRQSTGSSTAATSEPIEPADD